MTDSPRATEDDPASSAEDSADDTAPPMLIVAVAPPERRVGRIIGEMTSAQALRNAVTVSCGLNFAARRAATGELFHEMMHPSPRRRGRETDFELLAGAAQSRRSDAPRSRVEVCVEVGNQLVMVSLSPLGIWALGSSRCDG